MSPFHWFFNSFNNDKVYYGSVNFLDNQSMYQTIFSRPMFCTGSTLGRAQVPSYRDEKGQRHMLPISQVSLW